MEGDGAHDISDDATKVKLERSSMDQLRLRLPTSWERQLAYKYLRFVQSIGDLDS